MSVGFWFTDELSVVRYARQTDRYGKSIRDTSPELTTTLDVMGRLAEDAQTETPESALVITTAVAYLPTNTDVEAGDQIHHGDTVWEVTGVVNKKLPISASGSYVRCTLERITHG